MILYAVTVTEHYLVEAYAPEDARLAVEEGHARLVDMDVEVTDHILAGCAGRCGA